VKPSLRQNISLDLLLLVYMLLPRLYFFAPEIDSWDAVDFALGVHSFELTLYQPHFPGYPVFMACAKVFSLLGCSDAVALSLPGLLGLLGSLLLLRRALTRNFSLLVGFAAVMGLASLPIVTIFSVRPMSDALGLACLIVTLALGLDGRWRLMGAALGIALGVRLSYAPIVLSVLFLVWRATQEKRKLRGALFGFLGGCLLWLMPVLLLEGFAFFSEGYRFVTGHFTRWGGAIDADTDWRSRAQMLVWNLWAYGLGGLWPVDGVSLPRALSSLSAIGCFVGVALSLRVRAQRVFFFALFLPYFLWVSLGQNPESPRHMIPLLALLVGFAALSLHPSSADKPAVSKWGRTTGLIVSLGFLVTSLSLLQEQAATPAPQAALARYLQRSYPPKTRFYGWKTTRLVSYYAPQIEVQLMRSLPKLVEALKAAPTNAPVLFESKLSERRRRDRCFEVVQSFRRSRYLDPAYASITLFRDCGP
jgi:hypothetical protein